MNDSTLLRGRNVQLVWGAMRHKALAFCALTGAMLAAGPALADVTVNVSVSWHDFPATAAAVDVAALGADFGESACLLNMSGPSAGTCTVTFPDGVGSDAVSFFSVISLITCDQSAFLESGNISVLAPDCGTPNGGDPASIPTGAWLHFTDGPTSIAANAGQTVSYDITLAPDAGAGTIAGNILLPPGAHIAQGTVNSVSSGNGSVALHAYAALNGPNADGSYAYSIPSAVGAAPASLQFALRLPSGSEESFFAAAPAISTPGQTVTLDFPASGFTYVTGTVGWNTLQASSGVVTFFGPANGTAPIIVAPDGLTGTYEALLSADSLSNLLVSLGTCADPTSPCDPGVTASFQALDAIDTTGQGGQAISHDVSLPALFTTLSGAVSVDGATLQGGAGTLFAFDAANGQFTTTTFHYGADGAFDAVVGQRSGFAAFSATTSECVPQLDAGFPVDLGAAPVQQDFVIHVNAALPGAATVTVGLDAFAGATPPATYEVRGQWQGDTSVAYCNGGAIFVDQVIDGTMLTNLRAGPWTFSNTGSSTQAPGGAFLQREFVTPPQPLTVPAGGTASLSFVPNPPAFTGVLDMTSWQLGANDDAFVAAIDNSTNGDGSFSSFQYNTQGTPPSNLSVELLVGPNEPLAPATLEAGATYQTGPTSSSSWSSFANPALPTLTTGQVQSMPGLDAVQIAGIGTWTVTNLPVPAGSLFANALFSAQAGNLQLFGSADLEGSSMMRLKLPAGSYGSGPQVLVSYLDASSNFVSNTYPIGGEIAPGDVLTDTLHSPVLLNRTPAPGTYCPTAGDGTTRINVGFAVASAVQQLQSVTIAGKAVKAGASANATVLLPLGTWPSNVSATQKSGDRTNWDRTYTVPSQMSSSAPLGALVPDGTNPVPVPTTAIKPNGTATLSLQVSSCGLVVSNPNAFARPPRIVAISRNGQNLPLATIGAGSPDADGDIDFQLGSNGTWSLKVNTKLLGTGTFLLKIQAPDASLWNANFVVHQ